jgi:hypothetical protein
VEKSLEEVAAEQNRVPEAKAKTRMDTRTSSILAVFKPNRIIHKRTNANYNSFHLRVFIGLLNPQEQRHTSTLSIPRDNFGERKAKFNLGTSRTTQM